MFQIPPVTKTFKQLNFAIFVKHMVYEYAF